MPRKKTLSASKILFVGQVPPTAAHPSSGIKELFGLQSFGSTFSLNSEPIKVLGSIAPISYETTESPNIEFSFDYLSTNFDNEQRMGLVVHGSSGAFSRILNGEDERNYFMLTAAEGVDAVGANPANTPCVGYGNAVLNSYEFSAAVGDYPKVSATFLALNAKSYSDSTSEVLPSISASNTFTLPVASGNIGRDAILRPQDIQVQVSTISGIFYDLSDVCLNSASIKIDFNREPRKCAGSKYPISRKPTYPINVNFSFEFEAPQLVTGSLENFFCNTGSYNAFLTARRPSCYASGGSQEINFDLRGLRFISQSESVALGGDGTNVTINMITSLGSAYDSLSNLFLNGDKFKTFLEWPSDNSLVNFPSDNVNIQLNF